MKPKLDLYTVEFANSQAQNYVDSYLRKAKDLSLDARRTERIKERECPLCYYVLSGRSAGQSFTEWECRGCGKKNHHPNTGVPRLCTDCADKYGLCVQCCADVDLKSRRKLERSK